MYDSGPIYESTVTTTSVKHFKCYFNETTNVADSEAY